ncbi:copper amine oxidase N-terminal domain-containing protein, partial [Paenibacillus sp. y28]|uniref:copper amine oxidase N-terminal domain-containing protein n=1 Tax=Paenibacillus sp. y28 TaxID=3129110 RepID=UPI003015A48C
MKQLKITLLLVLIICMLPIGTAAAADPPTVSLNGKAILFDVAPINDNGHVLVQFRPLIEALGMTVAWEAKTKKITIHDGPWPIEIQIGAKSAKVNGESVTLDMPARIVDGVAMVPLRFVSEAAGKRVTWDDQANRVELSPGIDVRAKTLQLGGTSYDPTNYSFKNGRYATT